MDDRENSTVLSEAEDRAFDEIWEQGAQSAAAAEEDWSLADGEQAVEAVEEAAPTEPATPAEQSAEPDEQAAAESAPEREDLLGAQRRAELLRFAEEYTELGPEELPEEIWEAFREGRGGLTELYAVAENRRLRQELAALRQQQKNRERSTGSRQTAGRSAAQDAFDEGWASIE